MNLIEEKLWVGEPLALRVPEHRLDLRTDVTILWVGAADEGCRGRILDERTEFQFGTAQLTLHPLGFRDIPHGHRQAAVLPARPRNRRDADRNIDRAAV